MWPFGGTGIWRRSVSPRTGLRCPLGAALKVVEPPPHLRVFGIAHLDPGRPFARQQPIRRRRQLRHDALAIALADRTEEIDALADNVIGNKDVIASPHDP